MSSHPASDTFTSAFDMTDAKANEEIARAAFQAGKLEAAQHILDLWPEPWPVSRKTFIERLEAYVEELK